MVHQGLCLDVYVRVPSWYGQNGMRGQDLLRHNDCTG